MTLTKSERAALREMFGGRCAYCGHELPEKGWHADHIDAVIRQTKWRQNPKTGMGEYVATGKLYRPDNDRADGFYPACAKCNIEKSCGTIEDFRHGLERKVEVMRRNNANWNHLERFGVIAIVKPQIVFHFETFQHDKPL